jgi:oligosaccharide repeat unit polymerase
MYLVLLLVSLCVFVAVALAYLRQDFASIIHPISFYLLFHGLVFVVRPFFAYAFEYHDIYRAYGFFPSPETKAIAILCANLGLLAFVAGAWRNGNVPLVFRHGPADFAHRRRLIPAFLMVLALLGPIAAASLWSTFSATEWTMRMDRATGITINTTANGWFVDAQLLLVPLAVLFAWIFRFRLWSLAPLVVFVLMRAGTGGRGPFVVACVAAAILWLFDRRRRWPSARVVGLALALAAAFYLVGQDRGTAVKTLLRSGEVVEVREKSGFMSGMDFANLEFFEYLVETIPRKTGTYGYFVNNLQVFTEPIPRKLWSEKPIGAPIKLYNLFDYGTPVGMTNSLPGEGWAQLGYAGVIVWCGLWGAALGAVYARFARSSQGNFQVALYFAFLPIFVIAFRDGLLLTIVRTGVFYLTPILAWWLVARLLGVPEPALLRGRGPRSRTSKDLEFLDVPQPPPAARRRRQRPMREDPIIPRAWRPRPAARASQG